jgi:hypothetical protein
MADGPKQRTLTQLKPGDIIEWRDEKFGHHRKWRVHGIHIGGLTQESVICMEAIDKSPAWDEIDLPLIQPSSRNRSGRSIRQERMQRRPRCREF